MNSIDVSVIVPIYNAEQYISDLMGNLHEQVFQKTEFILVNDGSTDGTHDIISEKLSQLNDERFRYFENENKGVSAARNFGIWVARGEYVIFIDGDDAFTNDLVETYYNAIVKSKADIEFFNISAFNPVDGVTILNYVSNLKNGFHTFHETLKDVFKFKIQGYPFTYISKKELWTEGFPEQVRIAEDLYALVKILKLNPKSVAHYNSSSKYVYMLNEKSALRNNPNAEFECVQTTRKISDLFSKGTTDRAWADNLTVGLYFEFLRHALKRNDRAEVKRYRELIFKNFFHTRMPVLSRLKRIFILVTSLLATR